MVRYSLKTTGLRAVLLTTMFVVHPANVQADAPSNAWAEKHLTDNERAWLQSHPVIKVGYDGHFPPYSFIGDSNQLEGFAVDVMQIIGERLGVRFEPSEKLVWKDIFAAGQEKEIDLIPTMVKRPERLSWFSFSKPYIHKSLLIVTNQSDFSVHGEQDLVGRRIALVEGYQISMKIEEKYPTALHVYFPTLLDALNAVAIQDVDAAITFLGSAHYYRTKYLLGNLKYVAIVDRDRSPERIAVRNDWPELVGIVSKVLTSIDESTLLDLQAKWLPEDFLDSQVKVSLTAQERQWIRDHPIIRVGIDPEFAPFEFIDKGRYQGMTSDYINILEKRLGLTLKIQTGHTWTEAVRGAKNRTIDLLPCIGKTKQRQSFLEYSDPYLEFHRVIITRTDQALVAGLDDIRSMRVAVQRNSSHQGFIKESTTIQPKTYATLKESLTALADSRVDAFVGNVASATYWIRRLNLNNLKIAAPVSSEPQSLYFAARKDWPQLAAILNKGLASINQRHRRRISENWLNLKYEPTVDYQLIGFIAGTALLLVTLLSGYSVHVRRQNQKIHKAKIEVVAANENLKKLHNDLESLVQNQGLQLQQSQQNFRQAQKMETLGKFVGGITHDLNNVLGLIVNAVELLLLDSGKKDHKLRGLLTSIYDMGMNGAEMLQNLLLFSRKEQLGFKRVNLAKAAQSMIKLSRAGIQQQIDIEFHSESKGLFVLANETQIKQIILNLTTNAVDALTGRDRAKIMVRTYVFHADNDFLSTHTHAKGKDFGVVEVADNGEGIEQEHIDKIDL